MHNDHHEILAKISQTLSLGLIINDSNHLQTFIYEFIVQLDWSLQPMIHW
jgi:hypothetical protein